MALFIMVVALGTFCFLLYKRDKNKATKSFTALVPRPNLKKKGTLNIRLWCGRCLRCYRKENLDLEVKDEVFLTKDEVDAILIAAVFQFGTERESNILRKKPTTFGQLVSVVEATNSPVKKGTRPSN